VSGRVAVSRRGDEHELVNRSRGQHWMGSVHDLGGGEYSGEQLLEKRSLWQQSSAVQVTTAGRHGVQTGRQGEHGVTGGHGFGHGDALYLQQCGDLIGQTADFDTCQAPTSILLTACRETEIPLLAYYLRHVQIKV